jgi:nicotinate-nucleotide adenylyltransferase
VRRLGLFGGRFDPPHFGHLLVAQEALEVLALDEIWFIPAQSPPHKDAEVGAEHRFNMTLLATASAPEFKASRLEIERGGPSYAFDTVMEVRRRLPSVKPVFITGVDAYRYIDTWHRALELADAVEWVAISRPGYSLEGVEEPFRSRVRLLEGLKVEISSTEVRRRLAAGRPVRYLVPELVESYLVKHHLYRK